MFDEPKYPELDPNKKTAQVLWEERYATDKYLFGKEPSLAVKNYSSFLRKGRTLDVGMGEGRNTVYLAQQGFQMEGLDCSTKAIEKAKALATEKGVTIEAKTQNLDFFLMPLMKYDSIIMTYFRPQARFFNEIRRGLVLGGTFLLEAYTVDHAKHHKNPLVDFDQCYKQNEVLHNLKEFTVLFYKEIPEGDAHIVQVVAQKAKV